MRAFFASGAAADLVRLFCSWLAAGFLFTGALFVANAAFNNLGYPVLSTLFSWRATLGTIPFVIYGAQFGPVGLLVGQASGSVIFGTLAVITAFRIVGWLGSAVGQAGIGMAIPRNRQHRSRYPRCATVAQLALTSAPANAHRRLTARVHIGNCPLERPSMNPGSEPMPYLLPSRK